MALSHVFNDIWSPDVWGDIWGTRDVGIWADINGDIWGDIWIRPNRIASINITMRQRSIKFTLR